MDEQDSPIQLRLWYWEIYKKQNHGQLDREDVYNLVYVCEALNYLGYVLNEDGSDWVLPSAKSDADD